MADKLHEKNTSLFRTFDNFFLLFWLLLLLVVTIVFGSTGYIAWVFVLCVCVSQTERVKVFVNICVQIDHSTGKLANEWNLTDIKFVFIYKHYIHDWGDVTTLYARSIFKGNFIITQFYGRFFSGLWWVLFFICLFILSFGFFFVCVLQIISSDVICYSFISLNVANGCAISYVTSSHNNNNINNKARPK